jgi:cytoskeletal protein RodZ
MTNLPSRLRRHLSYANVMASIAVFVALGGVGYAAATINGNSIVKRTIGAGKLKKGTLTSSQVKQNALTGSVIDESSLATVPSAQTAVSATTAISATAAATADSAKSADTATSAESAQTANTAKSAENAAHADSADSAGEATTADSAATAGDADTLGGFSAQQLQLSCPADTDPFGGVCWDQTRRSPAPWVAASIDCADAGGRLPSLSELIAYIAQPGQQTPEPNWSGDTADVNEISAEEIVLVRNETASQTRGATLGFGYRCVFYPGN